MSQPISIDRAGRIVLPSEVRRRLSLGPGSRLTLEVIAERIELTPEAEPAADLVQSPSQRMVLRPTGKRFDAAAATREEREQLSQRSRRR
ncbi:MAG: AbrB/MazE/SpoVT family DNA-binding domain-containing protein [Burkholderiaceae bacterium]|nr:AbrB/MazE/SpoVT family DNA-binding domain-containing protein [Burkholderiaceae bacterium]